MRQSTLTWAMAGAALAIASAAPLAAAELQVDPGAATNRITFTSEVVGFAFTGTTEQIDGFLYWEGDSLFARASQLRFEVDLRTLDSGIGKRDRDMRKVLETGRWPRAVYTSAVVEHTRLDSAAIEAYAVRTQGTLSLHGVERPVQIDGQLTRDGDRWRIDARFSLRLEDYDIEAPSLAAFVKVSQEIAIEVMTVLTPAPLQEEE